MKARISGPFRRNEGSGGCAPCTKGGGFSRRLIPHGGLKAASGFQKGKALFTAPFLVPPSVLFSNQMLEDLDKIWALRHIIPDPTNPFFSNISSATEGNR